MNDTTQAPAPADPSTEDEYDPLAMLTDEERAALEEPDTIEDDQATADDAAQQAAEDDAAAAQAAAAEPAADAQQEAEAAQEDEAPDFQAQLDEFDQQLAGFKDQRKAVLAEYDDGDLTADELQEKLDELDASADTIKEQRAIAKHGMESEARAWADSVNGYLAQYPGLKASDDVLTAFDSAVRYITSNPAYASMSYDEQLAAAHAQVEFDAQRTGLQGVPPTKTAPAPDPKPTNTPAPAKVPGSDLRTPPPTLAHVPASEQSGANDSPFAEMQALIEEGNSDKIEAAYARMTPEQRDQFSSMDV